MSHQLIDMKNVPNSSP